VGGIIMNALKMYIKPENHKIIIDVPDEFSAEEELEIIIVSSGEHREKKSRKEAFGKYKGEIWMAPDFDEPLEDFREYMECNTL